MTSDGEGQAFGRVLSSSPLVLLRIALLGLILSAGCRCHGDPCAAFQLQGEGPPEPMFLTNSTPSKVFVDAARTGFFVVGGERVSLAPPVDWHQDPFKDRSWRFWLHTLKFIEPLLFDFASNGTESSFQAAASIALDYIDHQRSDRVGEFSWYDQGVGLRVTYLSYLYRAAEQGGLLDQAARKKLRCATVEHARWLYDDDNYKANHNHGLYEDAGLYIAARQLEGHPEAPAWKRRARDRFLASAKALVSEEGVYLEHSPKYHVDIAELISIASNVMDDVPALAELSVSMEKVSPWFAMPDGNYPLVGDTDMGRVAISDEARDDPKNFGFVAWLDAGAAVYRGARSYLMFVSWYHSRSHKHADDLSFVWAERGRRIVVDAGRYGYYYSEPGRKFAESSEAHNTLTLERGFSPRDAKPYGSGILSTATEGEWVGVLAKNPLLGPDHRRVLLLRPGRYLVVIDQLGGKKCPRSIRRLHFAPQLRAKPASPGGLIEMVDDASSVWVHPVAASRDDVTVIRGQRQPRIQGFMFSRPRTWEENTVVELSATTCNEPMVIVLADGERPVVSARTAAGNVELTLDGEVVRMSFADDAFSISVERGDAAR